MLAKYQSGICNTKCSEYCTTSVDPCATVPCYVDVAPLEAGRSLIVDVSVDQPCLCMQIVQYTRTAHAFVRDCICSLQQRWPPLHYQIMKFSVKGHSRGTISSNSQDSPDGTANEYSHRREMICLHVIFSQRLSYMRYLTWILACRMSVLGTRGSTHGWSK